MPAFNHQNNFRLKPERGHEARGYVIAATFLINGSFLSQRSFLLSETGSEK